MRVLVLQHIACEHPGVFSRGDARARRGAGARSSSTRASRCPTGASSTRVLAMGGPMGAGDDADHPWLAAERRLVREAVEAGRPFLGVCLGVQLLAAALGARVYEAERPEVGLLAVELTAGGPRRPAVRAASTTCSSPCSGTATPSTSPTGAVRLASSPLVRQPGLPRRASAPTGSSSTSRSRARWRAEWAEIPAYRALARRDARRAAGRRVHRRDRAPRGRASSGRAAPVRELARARCGRRA